jgi:hypothetical protein
MLVTLTLIREQKQAILKHYDETDLSDKSPTSGDRGTRSSVNLGVARHVTWLPGFKELPARNREHRAGEVRITITPMAVFT